MVEPVSLVAPEPEGCAEGELSFEGACVRPGVPLDGCAEGFVHDGGYGCAAVLPAEPCPPGLIAVPGDEACREVAPCGEGPWGDIPIEADTEHVDGAYAGSDSDGSAERPWTSVQQGLEAAGEGALVAVAAGTYVEDLEIPPKGVRLWGRCPSMVTLTNAGASIATVVVADVPAAVEIHRLAVTGNAFGVAVSAAPSVLLDEVWLHDTGSVGLAIELDLGPASVELRDSLVESCGGRGASASGTTLSIARSAIRGTYAAGKFRGEGVFVAQKTKTAVAGRATIADSLLEDNQATAIFVQGSELDLNASVVRDTRAGAGGKLGRGLTFQDDEENGARASVTLGGVVFDMNREVAIAGRGSDAIIDRTVVRRTQPTLVRAGATGEHGWGIGSLVYDTPPAAGEQRASFTVTRSLVSDNHSLGIAVVGSHAEISETVVRATRQGHPAEVARAIAAQNHPVMGRAGLSVRDSLVEDSDGVGIYLRASDATVTQTVVKATHPTGDGRFGRGLVVEHDDVTLEAASIVVNGLHVDDSVEVGFYLNSSSATLDGLWVRNTRATDAGLYGDGVLLIAEAMAERAQMSLRRSRIENSQRAGLSSFGGHVALESTEIVCSGFDIDVESHGGNEASFDMGEGVACGCTEASDVCNAVSAGLMPPEPVGGLEP